MAKRRLSETWREAVSRHAAASGLADPCLRQFDAGLAAGESEAAAAFRALEAHGLLSAVPIAAPAPVPSDPAVPPA